MKHISNNRFELILHAQTGPGKNRCGDYVEFYWENKDWLVCALADGVSAYPCDWKASEVSCTTALNSLIDNEELIHNPEKWLELAVQEAHQAVFSELGPCENMMAALAIFLWKVETNQAYFVNIGDTRIYLVQQDTFKQLTEDDVEFVRITRNKKQVFDQSGLPETAKGVTKSIGQRAPLQFNVQELNFPSGSGVFLCSDGAHAHGNLDAMWHEALLKCNLANELKYIIGEARHFTDDDASVLILRRKDWPEGKANAYANLPETLLDPEVEKLIPYLVATRILNALEEAIDSGDHERIKQYLDYLEMNKLYPDKNSIIRLMDKLVSSQKPDSSLLNRLRSFAYKVY